MVGDADSAFVAAAQLGYPLAVKLAEGGVHKTDVGGVRLDVQDEAELRQVFAELAELCPGRPAVLLQPMTPSGTEVILGAVQRSRKARVIRAEPLPVIDAVPSPQALDDRVGDPPFW